MHKIGWFTLGIIVALSVSTIADEGKTPDESQLRDLAASAEISVRFENKLQDLEQEAARLAYSINYRQQRGIYYAL